MCHASVREPPLRCCKQAQCNWRKAGKKGSRKPEGILEAGVTQTRMELSAIRLESILLTSQAHYLCTLPILFEPCEQDTCSIPKPMATCRSVHTRTSVCDQRLQKLKHGSTLLCTAGCSLPKLPWQWRRVSPCHSNSLPQILVHFDSKHRSCSFTCCFDLCCASRVPPADNRMCQD